MANYIFVPILIALQFFCCLTRAEGQLRQPRASMLLSCEEKPFVSVSVSTPKRDGLPLVDILVLDPRNREQGHAAKGKLIPKSHYADVVQVPDDPELSREQAVEICGAIQGVYEVDVSERGNEPYRLEVQVGDESLSTLLDSNRAGVRKYRFSFRIDSCNQNEVNLFWLDKHGKHLVYLPESR